MVSGCVGFLGVFAVTLGPCQSSMAAFVRKVSRIFQVVSSPCCGAASPVAGILHGGLTSCAAAQLSLILVAAIAPTAVHRTHRVPQSVFGDRTSKGAAAYARRPEVHPAVHARVGHLVDGAREADE